MTIRRDVFATAIKASLFGGRLTQTQWDGISAILDEWERRELTDLRHLAYIFATPYYECTVRGVRTMQPVKEVGSAAYFNKRYGVEGTNPSRARKMGNTRRGDGARYCGRGFVQLTWKVNYQKMGDLLGVDLVGNPDLAMQLDIATQVLFEGMLRADSGVGDFTGKALENYFNDSDDDPINARRIINGTDKAQLIAGYHESFLEALTAASAPAEEPMALIGDAPARVAAIEPAAEPVVVPHGRKSPEFEMIQRRLKALGYHEVGICNGEWGGRMTGAIAAFKNDRLLPPGPAVVDDVLKAELDKAEAEGWARPISQERANGLPPDGSRIVAGAERQGAAGTATVVAGGGGVLAWIADKVDWLRDTLMPVKSFIAPVANFVAENWMLVALGVGGFLIWQAARIRAARVEDFQSGKSPT